jgi:hypothetical protein
LACSGWTDNDKGIILDDDKHQDQEPYKVNETYDYLPQGIFLQKYDRCVVILTFNINGKV